MQTSDGIRILVADDDNSVVDFIIACIGTQACIKKILKAEDGSVALRKIENQQFDIVIMDIEMPRVKGTKVIQDTVASKILKPDNFLVISAHLNSEEIKTVLKSGVTNVLVKPLTKDKLIEKINAMLKKLKLTFELAA